MTFGGLMEQIGLGYQVQTKETLEENMGQRMLLTWKICQVLDDMLFRG